MTTFGTPPLFCVILGFGYSADNLVLLCNQIDFQVLLSWVDTAATSDPKQKKKRSTAATRIILCLSAYGGHFL